MHSFLFSLIANNVILSRPFEYFSLLTSFSNLVAMNSLNLLPSTTLTYPSFLMTFNLLRVREKILSSHDDRVNDDKLFSGIVSCNLHNGSKIWDVSIKHTSTRDWTLWYLLYDIHFYILCHKNDKYPDVTGNVHILNIHSVTPVLSTRLANLISSGMINDLLSKRTYNGAR